VRYTTFSKREQRYIYGYEGSQAVPTHSSVKGILKRNKVFGSDEGRQIKVYQQENLSRALCIQLEF
jgi:hypothetical protein